MNIDSIHDGVVIDHIRSGGAMQLYALLGLDKLDCPVAIIKNAPSGKLGKKDIIKIDSAEPLNLDVLGFVDPDATINVIKNGVLVEKKTLALPEKLTNVLKCKNPRCITSCEQELPHVFKLADRAQRLYRCIYCETKA